MSLESEVVIVSGLPRSGTSLMMQMLDRGGIPALTDEIRTPDTDNPRGYFEFEQVKKVREDQAWLPRARGKAVKLVSSLLYDLPDSETYRVVFMERDMNEVLESQERMLKRLDRPVLPREQIRASFAIHLERLHAWLPWQDHLRLLRVNYNTLVTAPELELLRVSQFLDGRVNPDEMHSVIDPSLYRNRNHEAARADGMPQQR
jgi:hypothetical protein